MKSYKFLVMGLILLLVLAANAAAVAKTILSPDQAKNKPQPGIAGWEEKWENTLAAAKKEGKIVIYGFVGPQLRSELTGAIKKEFGLDVELVVGKGAEVATRFMAEWQAGIHRADIMLFGASTFLSTLNPELVLDPLRPTLIRPETTDPKAWRDGKLPFIDNAGKVIPLTVSVLPYLMVNTDLVNPGEIKAYRDLLQPKWKGKITMFNPTISGTANGWVTLILTKAYGPGEGEKFLRQFAGQEPVVLRDSRLQIEWLAHGKYPVSVAVDTQSAFGMHKAGAPITRLAAEEGGNLSGGGSYIGISAKRPHPNATSVLMNWFLGPRGQQLYSKGFGAPAAREGITTEGASQLALPLPGEKLFLADEENIRFYRNAREKAKVIFGSLIK